MSNYDCTEDVEMHIGYVNHFLKPIIFELMKRGENHDASKLQEPEKSMYDEFTPRLKELEFGSEEYKASLKDMGKALDHHYQENRHHPEHWSNGINDMTLVDLVEMVCDWKAASFLKGEDVNMEYLSKRFGISDQLQSIILSTLKEME
jgi:Family of unknown function (DUF5662)